MAMKVKNRVAHREKDKRVPPGQFVKLFNTILDDWHYSDSLPIHQRSTFEEHLTRDYYKEIDCHGHLRPTWLPEWEHFPSSSSQGLDRRSESCHDDYIEVFCCFFREEQPSWQSEVTEKGGSIHNLQPEEKLLNDR